jgi:hypothetical protein
MASTRFTSTIDYWRLESGFPLLEDTALALREVARMECAFKEQTPQNWAWAYGIDASSGYTEAHSGEVALGALSDPTFIRMEALYTYPSGTDYLNIIFPRAQVTASIEADFQAEDAVAVPATFEAKRADSETSGGNAAWDDKPLGRVLWT